jgi:hypothetical protein
MTGFWKREDELEAELRASRPEPPSRLVDGLVARVEAKGRRPRSRLSGRIALAGVMTAAAIAVFGAFGGLSYAAKSVASATGIQASHDPAPPVRAPGSSPTRQPSTPPSTSGGNGSSENGSAGSSSSANPSAATVQYGRHHTTPICYPLPPAGGGSGNFVVLNIPDSLLWLARLFGATLVNPNPPPVCPGPPITIPFPFFTGGVGGGTG